MRKNHYCGKTLENGAPCRELRFESLGTCLYHASGDAVRQVVMARKRRSYIQRIWFAGVVLMIVSGFLWQIQFSTHRDSLVSSERTIAWNKNLLGNTGFQKDSEGVFPEKRGSAIKIFVFNGSRLRRAGGEMARVLKGLGYKIREVRNAPRTSWRQKVEFGLGAKKQAREISILLSGKDVSVFNSNLAEGNIYVTVGQHPLWQTE